MAHALRHKERALPDALTPELGDALSLLQPAALWGLLLEEAHHQARIPVTPKLLHAEATQTPPQGAPAEPRLPGWSTGV